MNIEVEVSVYNEHHRKLLKKSPVYKNIAKIDGKVVEFSREDFLTYALFREQKNHTGFKTFKDFKKKLPYRIDIFNDYLDESSNTITAKFNTAEKQLIVTEYIGIGGGLSVISRIHGLTEADWNIIPDTGVKDLDYWISSDGKNIVEVECKGAFANPKLRISRKKKEIEDKKTVQRDDKNNKNLLYGVITSYDNSGQLAHCRILDPVSDNEYDSPWKLRLLSRLNFYLRELSLISNSKSHFLIALSTKLQVLRLLGKEEIERTDNLPLSRPDGVPFPFPISFKNKTRILENSGFGDILEVGENKYLFYGFRNEVVEALIKQNYSEILKMKFPTKTINTQIKAKLPKRDVEQQLYGEVMQTSAGRLFGIFHYE